MNSSFEVTRLRFAARISRGALSARRLTISAAISRPAIARFESDQSIFGTTSEYRYAQLQYAWSSSERGSALAGVVLDRTDEADVDGAEADVLEPHPAPISAHARTDTVNQTRKDVRGTYDATVVGLRELSRWLCDLLVRGIAWALAFEVSFYLVLPSRAAATSSVGRTTTAFSSDVTGRYPVFARP
jgi:hypothetical protein